jgi:hypothetical protein
MPNKSSAIGTYSDISEAAFVGMAVVTIADVITLLTIPAHTRLPINSRVFIHQPKDDMVQLLVGVFESTLNLLEPAFHALQCS